MQTIYSLTVHRVSFSVDQFFRICVLYISHDDIVWWYASSCKLPLLQYQARHKILTHSAFLCAIGAWLDVNMLTPRVLRHILVGGLEHFLFFHIYWESSSQLTNSYFSVYHQPVFDIVPFDRRIYGSPWTSFCWRRHSRCKRRNCKLWRQAMGGFMVPSGYD